MALVNDLTDKVKVFYRLKVAKEAAEHEMDGIKPEILSMFRRRIDAGGDGKLRISEPGEYEGHVTYVPPGEITNLDVDGLLEHLTPEQRDKVTTATIDQAKLAAAVQLGLVDGELIKRFTEVKERSAYIKFTVAPAEKPEEPIAVAPSKAKPRRLVATRRS